MFWTIVGVLFVLWLLGLGFKIGGKLIHALLVIVLIIIIYRLLF
ncbi:MAG: lmo0937 family membrane protein [Candidatus Liptonbacteria bacterium]|nr:lmo0937 family membrane protein [Candidatus Liptonbacteria bacterium]